MNANVNEGTVKEGKGEALIEVLETKIAFLEVANDELERVLLLQHERLEKMEMALKELRNALQEQAAQLEGLEPSESEPPPPHY